MQQQKAITCRAGSVLEVQAADLLDGRLEQNLVTVDLLARRIGPVRKQGEADVTVQARQVVNLQVFDVFGERLASREQDRHDHERPQPAGIPPASSISASGRALKRLAMLLFATAIAASTVSTRPSIAEYRERRSAVAANPQHRQWPRQRRQREQCDSGDVAADSHSGDEPREPRPQRRPIIQSGLERTTTPGDEVIARVAFAPAAARGRGLHGELGDVQLGVLRAARQLLDRVATAVARRKIRLRIIRVGAPVRSRRDSSIRTGPPSPPPRSNACS